MAVVVVLIKYDLGVIAFVVSVLLAIWVFGLRDKFDSETTASAYSVFNKDGQAITGGFTTAQLERQLRGGFGRDDATKGSNDVPTLSSKQKAPATENVVSDDEKLRRRRAAAAAAAERRFAKANEQ